MFPRCAWKLLLQRPKRLNFKINYHYERGTSKLVAYIAARPLPIPNYHIISQIKFQSQILGDLDIFCEIKEMAD